MEGTSRHTLKKLVIVANAPTPYRTHFHERIVREMDHVHLTSVFTHGVSNAPWSAALPDTIRPLMLGGGQSSEDSWLRTARAEWAKGGSIIDLFRENRPDIVIVYGYADPARVRLIRWCSRNRIPCFVWGDSNILGDRRRGLKARVKRLLLRRLLSRATGAMCCGSLGKAYFEWYGVPTDRIFFVPYEPDYALIQNLPATAVDHAVARFELPRFRRRIVFSGRLALVKRPDLLIDAFARIAAERPDWDLLIVGDGPLKAELKQRVPAHLTGRVFWTGFLDDQQTVSALYRASDVLVLPSDYEPWALVINEAAAAGLAIVASEVVGAAAELVLDGVNGYRFRVGSLDHLVQCLHQATAPESIDDMKQASAEVLKVWRENADPLEGVRRAMGLAGRDQHVQSG